MTVTPVMRFFTDQNVPESVAKALEGFGYEVLRLRERTAVNSPDNLVAAVSEANDAILVSFDGDFKAIAGRTGIGKRSFRRLSLVRFEKCREINAAARLTVAMSLIEHEWEKGNGTADRRIFVVECGSSIRTHR